MMFPKIKQNVVKTWENKPTQVQCQQSKVDEALKNLNEDDRQIVFNLLVIEDNRLHELLHRMTNWRRWNAIKIVWCWFFDPGSTKGDQSNSKCLRGPNWIMWSKQ